MLFTNLFATLLLAHLLADFPLQTNSIHSMKNQGSLGITVHVVIHIVTTMLLLEFKTEIKAGYLLIISFIGFSHFIIDWLKFTAGSKLPVLRMFVVDQYLHLLSLVAAIGICRLFNLETPNALLPEIWLLRALTLAFCLALMVMGWLWLNTLDRQRIHQNPYLAWSQQRLLLIEQRLGLLLVVWLVVITFVSVDL